MNDENRTDEQTDARETRRLPAEQASTSATEVRPDLAVSPEEESEKTSDRRDRRRAPPDVTVADNAGRPPGADQGDPDTGDEASSSLSEPG